MLLFASTWDHTGAERMGGQGVQGASENEGCLQA